MHDCSRLARIVNIMTALIIAAGVFGCEITSSTAPTTPSAQAAQAEKTAAPAQVQGPGYQAPSSVAYFAPPGKIDFCGEQVPLEKRDVLERFDKEFTVLVHNHAQVYWWLKHKESYFPGMQERLRRLNLPDDLKYVAIAESEPPLNAPVKKKSAAADMRYDFESNPDSALQYLGDLYRQFHSWSVAIAAYNCGEKCINDQVAAQGDFYQMILPQETERYVFRILAIKAILSDPTRYGYELPKGAGYP